MAIGPCIRHALGPYERSAAEIYRKIFVDLDALASYLKSRIPADGLNIVEIGCGEGMFTSRLAAAYPDSQIAAIDITEKAGKMFTGDLSRCVFSRQSIGDFAGRYPNSADLIVIVDVLHHISKVARKQFLIDAGKILKRGGCIMLKDWAKNTSLIHFLSYFSDRYITGDRVHYKTIDEWRILIESVFGANSIKGEKRIRPWPNNVAFIIQPVR